MFVFFHQFSWESFSINHSSCRSANCFSEGEGDLWDQRFRYKFRWEKWFQHSAAVLLKINLSLRYAIVLNLNQILNRDGKFVHPDVEFLRISSWDTKIIPLFQGKRGHLQLIISSPQREMERKSLFENYFKEKILFSY